MKFLLPFLFLISFNLDARLNRGTLIVEMGKKYNSRKHVISGSRERNFRLPDLSGGKKCWRGDIFSFPSSNDSALTVSAANCKTGKGKASIQLANSKRIFNSNQDRCQRLYESSNGSPRRRFYKKLKNIRFTGVIDVKWCVQKVIWRNGRVSIDCKKNRVIHRTREEMVYEVYCLKQ